jgi:hypothetical protein
MIATAMYENSLSADLLYPAMNSRFAMKRADHFPSGTAVSCTYAARA